MRISGERREIRGRTGRPGQIPACTPGWSWHRDEAKPVQVMPGMVASLVGNPKNRAKPLNSRASRLSNAPVPAARSGGQGGWINAGPAQASDKILITGIRPNRYRANTGHRISTAYRFFIGSMTPITFSWGSLNMPMVYSNCLNLNTVFSIMVVPPSALAFRR